MWWGTPGKCPNHGEILKSPGGINLDNFFATNVDDLKLGDFSYNSILHVIATFFKCT